MPHTISSDYRLPTTTLDAHLVLTSGEEHRGIIYLAERSAEHPTGETPLEMLNGPQAFFPFRAEGGILLVGKAQTAALIVERVADDTDPERLSVAKTVGIQVILAGGMTVDGWASVELPQHQSRPLDYLNTAARPFFAVATDDAIHHLNRQHVLYARPRE